MTEPATWLGLGFLIVSNIGLWIDKIAMAKKGKNNGKPPCEDHRGRLIKLELNEENRDKKIDLFIDHNDKAHEKIFERLGIIG